MFFRVQIPNLRSWPWMFWAGLVNSTNPRYSMYGLFTSIWLKFMVNVGIYTIHWAFGNGWLCYLCFSVLYTLTRICGFYFRNPVEFALTIIYHETHITIWVWNPVWFTFRKTANNNHKSKNLVELLHKLIHSCQRKSEAFFFTHDDKDKNMHICGKWSIDRICVRIKYIPVTQAPKISHIYWHCFNTQLYSYR